jgi:hypothetical protein
MGIRNPAQELILSGDLTRRITNIKAYFYII